MTSVRHRFTFNTIVVATDLTHSSSGVLEYAKRIAQLHKSKLVIVQPATPFQRACPSRSEAIKGHATP